MATGKKKPTTPNSGPKTGTNKQATAKPPITPRNSAPRKAAKPPVINVKATEVKSTSPSDTQKKSVETKSDKKSGNPTSPPAKPNLKSNDKKAPLKTTQKPSGTQSNKKPSNQNPSKKKKGKTGLIIVSLAALIAAGLGGAWAFKQYGQKFFTPANAENTAQIAAIGEKLTATNKRIDTIQTSITSLSKQVSANKNAQETLAQNLSEVKKSLTQVDTALKAAAKKGAGPADAANSLALEKLNAKLANLDNTISNLKTETSKTSATSSKTDKALNDLKAQIKTLSQTLSQTQSIAKASSDQLAATTKALAALKAAQTKLENEPTSSQSGKLASAFTILRAKVSNGKPFSEQLNQIAASLPQELSIDKLREFAQTGAPTNNALLKQLTNLSLNAKPQQAEPETKTGNGAWSTLTNKLSGLVKVSKVGETDWQAVQHQAVTYLKSGDLKAAVNAINMAKQQPPKPLSEWLALADKKIRIDAAIEQLSASVMARLTAGAQ